jgi:hypothetical protein
MRRTSEERKQMVAAPSNNLNEYALCEATAQKAEHFSHVREKTRKSRGSDNLANAACWRFQPLQGSVESIRTPAAAFAVIDVVPSHRSE